MLHISAAALLLFGTGFLPIMFSITSIQAHPGQNVTMWCPHNIYVSGNLYWFKQTDGAVPITIVSMLYTESLQKVEPNYFNNFREDRMIMDQFSKNTTLTIKQVNISDSSFYFCGATGYHMKFGSGTRLEVKEKNDTGTSKKDHEQSSVSTEECSRDIYFNLTLLFGGIIVFTCIVLLILAIIREHRRQKHQKAVSACRTQQYNDKENESVEYAAVYFANKRSKTAGQHTEDLIAVYTDTA